MRTRDEIRQDFVEALDEEADPRLTRFGLKRRRSTDEYIRKPGQSIQRLDFRPTYRPQFYPGAEIYLYPHVRVEMPAIGEKALEIVNGDAWPWRTRQVSS